MDAFKLILVSLAGWMNCQQQHVIEYLQEEIRILKELQGATDFFTVEVWTLRGLVRYHVLFVIRLSTRKVNIAGIVPEPDGLWMKQVARNLTDGVNGFLSGYRYLIHDRAPVFTSEFEMILESAGVKSVRLPPRSPNLNSFAERFVRSIKSECLERMILIGEGSLRRAISILRALPRRAEPSGLG